MTTARLELTREQILTHRRTVGALDERLPAGPESLRRAAWAGLQDSAPRAAVLSIHARVQETAPDAWDDPSLVQLWGPRFSAYVVAARDLAVFSLGRLPDDAKRRHAAQDLGQRLAAFLAGRTIPYAEAGRGLGVHPNELRYAAPTGTVLIRWDGARQPTIWTVPPPDVDPTRRPTRARAPLPSRLRTGDVRDLRGLGRDPTGEWERGVRCARRIGHTGPDTRRRCLDPERRRADIPLSQPPPPPRDSSRAGMPTPC